MSIQTLMGTINNLSKDIANLEKQYSDESKKESDKVKRINDIQRSITKNTSISSLSSKQRDITSLNNDIARITQKKADIYKKIADKKAKLNTAQEQLYKEQERERKMQEDAQKKREKEYLMHQRSITEELRKQKQLLNNNIYEFAIESNGFSSNEQYDVFISHASEDKDELVRPLATLLTEKYNLKVWYDEFTLEWGDKLRRKIDKGLASSKYGIVVLSKNFFSKEWPQYELDALFDRQIKEDKVILPIWHKLSKDEVSRYCPTVSSILALDTFNYTIEEIAEKVNKIVIGSKQDEAEEVK